MKRALKITLISLVIPIGIAIGIARVMMTSDCACTDKADAIVNSLAQLDAAKVQWLIDHQNMAATNLTLKNLSPYFQPNLLDHPIADETYFINKIGEPASAIVPQKTDWIPANSEVHLIRLVSGDGKVQIRSTAPGSEWTTP
jgi:hypothetical protein